MNQQPPGNHGSRTPSGRLLCLDLFRGLAVAGMVLVDNPGDDRGAYAPIQHTLWNGWTPADLIFPSFVFLVGVSMVFSFSRRLERGESRRQIFIHAVKRALLLLAIGLFLNGFPLFHLADWRILGVLQRIAACYLAAAVLVLWQGWRGQLVALLVCLVGYWAILRFVPVPGFGVPGRDIPFMDPEGNLVAWLDRKLFPGRLYNVVRDPEGVISTIPAIATALAGVLAGHWLRRPRTEGVKVAGLLGAGLLGLLVGELWNVWFPINKNLWTSSFVVFTAGFALVFLGLLYWMTELRRWRGSWTVPILVLGMNPIAGFFADALVYGPGYSFTLRGPGGAAIPLHEWIQLHLLGLPIGTANASLVYSLGAVLFCWLLLLALYKKKIFLKV